MGHLLRTTFKDQTCALIKEGISEWGDLEIFALLHFRISVDRDYGVNLLSFSFLSGNVCCGYPGMFHYCDWVLGGRYFIFLGQRSLGQKEWPSDQMDISRF